MIVGNSLSKTTPFSENLGSHLYYQGSGLSLLLYVHNSLLAPYRMMQSSPDFMSCPMYDESTSSATQVLLVSTVGIYLFNFFPVQKAWLILSVYAFTVKYEVCKKTFSCNF